MKISYNWLKTYFKEKLPPPEKLADLFTFHAFEVESFEKLESRDYVFDIKVLPDRAHYALSHQGIALEAGALTGLQKSVLPIEKTLEEEATSISLEVLHPLCRRYVAQVMRDVKVAESPEWLKERLQAVGQRPINNIVDATNYLMLDMGQPLHAFDADKIKGGLVIRSARKGESLETLDGKKVALDSEILVEADHEKVLAIAGIKGGKFSGINENTKNIIIIAGNFEPTTIRRTSMRIDIRTDASKRFENNLSPEFPEEAILRITALVTSFSPKARAGSVADYYPQKPKQVNFPISLKEIHSFLGVSISRERAIGILRSLEIGVEEKNDELFLFIPLYRHDLNSTQDIAEEIGRIYGYENIPPKLPEKAPRAPKIEKMFYYSEKIKNILSAMGFSEVYTYSLVSEGFYEIEKPLAEDKNYLRADLSKGIANALESNAKNADLLALETIKIFEIGSVFPKAGEHTALAIGIKNVRKKNESANERIRSVREQLFLQLGARINTLCTVDDTGGLLILEKKQIGTINATDGILELNVDLLIAELPDPESYADLKFKKTPSVAYQKFSSHPFIVRDIAVFVTDKTNKESLLEIITQEAGELLAKIWLFDVFTRDGKTSYAYRLVFQAMERTLLQEEADAAMEKIYAHVKEKGWTVR